jgi:2-haloacid dehalogenase
MPFKFTRVLLCPDYSPVRNSTASYTSVIFDLGGVLIDWNPRHLYRQFFPGDDAALERFLAEVTTSEWNRELDGGRSFAEAIADLQHQHPEHHELIAMYWDRWPEMLGGVNDGTVQLVRDLKSNGLRVFALSDWSAETFPLAKRAVPELGLFDDIQISGEAGMTKLDPRAFGLAIARFNVDPAATVFIDDAPANLDGARAAGLTALRFTGADALRTQLTDMGLL